MKSVLPKSKTFFGLVQAFYCPTSQKTRFLHKVHIFVFWPNLLNKVKDKLVFWPFWEVFFFPVFLSFFAKTRFFGGYWDFSSRELDEIPPKGFNSTFRRGLIVQKRGF